jgi:DNA polymerase III epsilon subunit-like protein
LLYFIDVETTGLDIKKGAELVEVAVLRGDGKVALNTFVKPKKGIPLEATSIHGITDEMVKDAPGADEIIKKVLNIAKGNTVVIYNADYDSQFFPGITDIATIKCAMKEYSRKNGEWDEMKQRWQWFPLAKAAEKIGCKLPKGLTPHRALSDCFITKSVWEAIESPKKFRIEGMVW